MLTNSLGVTDKLRIEFTTHTVVEGDRYLICSDGLCSYVEEDEIYLKLKAAKTPSESVSQLIHSSLRVGGPDNITVVALFL